MKRTDVLNDSMADSWKEEMSKKHSHKVHLRRNIRPGDTVRNQAGWDQSFEGHLTFETRLSHTSELSNAAKTLRALNGRNGRRDNIAKSCFSKARSVFSPLRDFRPNFAPIQIYRQFSKRVRAIGLRLNGKNQVAVFIR